MSTDEVALLAAIEAAPNDDAPRLVYADWLQERGAEAKAEYLRAVVRLLHPPEDPTVVAHCLDLATGLDADWRRRVGGRFEVILEGSGPLLFLAHAFQAVVSLLSQDAMGFFYKGEPVRIRRNLTREDAEQVTRSFEVDRLKPDGSGEPMLRMSVRPMAEDPIPG